MSSQQGAEIIKYLQVTDLKTINGNLRTSTTATVKGHDTVYPFWCIIKTHLCLKYPSGSPLHKTYTSPGSISFYFLPVSNSMHHS